MKAVVCLAFALALVLALATSEHHTFHEILPGEWDIVRTVANVQTNEHSPDGWTSRVKFYPDNSTQDLLGDWQLYTHKGGHLSHQHFLLHVPFKNPMQGNVDAGVSKDRMRRLFDFNFARHAGMLTSFGEWHGLELSGVYQLLVSSPSTWEIVVIPKDFSASNPRIYVYTALKLHESHPEFMSAYQFYEGEWEQTRLIAHMKAAKQAHDGWSGRFGLAKQNGTLNLAGPCYNQLPSGQILDNLTIVAEFTSFSAGKTKVGPWMSELSLLYAFDVKPMSNGVGMSFGEWHGTEIEGYYSLTQSSANRFELLIMPKDFSYKAQDPHLYMYLSRRLHAPPADNKQMLNRAILLALAALSCVASVVVAKKG